MPFPLQKAEILAHLQNSLQKWRALTQATRRIHFLNLFGIMLFRTMLFKDALTEPNEQPMPDLAAKYDALHAERNL